MNQPINQINSLLQMADNALILGHRLSEWCGHGPVLEQDIALANISLDHLGQARSLYQYAAVLYNSLSNEDKASLFSSAALQQKLENGEVLDEDDLAYLRDAWDFKNVLLVEQPNKDWAYTVVRSFFYDAFNFYYYTSLLNNNNPTIAAIAEKSLKEVTYHLRWSSEWMIRLGDGTDESHKRTQEAVDERWMFSGELFNASDADKAMGIGIEAIKAQWLIKVEEVMNAATLTLPANAWMQEGGKNGIHTEHLGYLLAEMQFMQRAYPNMEW